MMMSFPTNKRVSEGPKGVTSHQRDRCGNCTLYRKDNMDGWMCRRFPGGKSTDAFDWCNGYTDNGRPR